jgi:hypothetical protein
MLPLFIAILLGLTSPSNPNYTQNTGLGVTTNSSGGEDSEGGSTGGTGSTGGDTGQLPPPPITGG